MTDLQRKAITALSKAFIEAGMTRELAIDNAVNCMAACLKANEESSAEAATSN